MDSEWEFLASERIEFLTCHAESLRRWTNTRILRAHDSILWILAEVDSLVGSALIYHSFFRRGYAEEWDWWDLVKFAG